MHLIVGTTAILALGRRPGLPEHGCHVDHAEQCHERIGTAPFHNELLAIKQIFTILVTLTRAVWSSLMSKIAVTGARGALGGSLVSVLAGSAGRSVVAIDKDKPDRGGPNVDVRCLDLRDFDELKAALEGVEKVFHCASLHGKDLHHTPHDTFFANNVLSLFNVLSICEQVGCSRLIVTSSTSIYGASIREIVSTPWYTETVTPLCTDVYDRTKLIGEQLCSDAARRANMTIVSLRTARFFIGDWVSHNIRKLYRDVDIRDVVQAHLLAEQADLPPGHHVYNIASEPCFHPQEGLRLYEDPGPLLYERFPILRDLVRERGWVLPLRIDRVYDINRAQQHLGYRPRFTFSHFLHNLPASPPSEREIREAVTV